MAIAFVQSDTCNSSGVASLTGVTVGNLLIAMVMCKDFTPSWINGQNKDERVAFDEANFGWKKLYSNNNIYIKYKVADKTNETLYAAGETGGYGTDSQAGILAEYSGIGPLDYLHKYVVVSDTGVTGYDSGETYSRIKTGMAIAFMGHTDNAAADSGAPNNSFTQRAEIELSATSPEGSIILADKTLSGEGYYSTQCTGTSSGDSFGVLLYIQPQNIQVTSSQGSLTAAWGNTPKEGNLLVAAIVDNSGAQQFTIPAGWTEITTADNNITACYKIAGASESTSITFSGSTTSQTAVVAAEYEDITDIDPLITSGNDYTSAANKVVSGDANLTEDLNGLIVTILAATSMDASESIEPSNLYMEDVEEDSTFGGGGGSILIANRRFAGIDNYWSSIGQDTAGTQTTGTDSGDSIGIIAAFNPATTLSAVAYEQGAASDGDIAEIHVSLPSPATAGNLLVMGLLRTAAGFSLFDEVVGLKRLGFVEHVDGNARLFYCIAQGGEQTLNLKGHHSDVAFVVEYSGIDADIPIHGVASKHQTSVTGLDSGDVAFSEDVLVVAMLGHSQNQKSDIGSPNNSFTQRVSAEGTEYLSNKSVILLADKKPSPSTAVGNAHGVAAAFLTAGIKRNYITDGCSLSEAVLYDYFMVEYITNNIILDDILWDGFPYYATSEDNAGLQALVVGAFGRAIQQGLTLDELLSPITHHMPQLNDTAALADATSGSGGVILGLVTDTLGVDDVLTPNQVLYLALENSIGVAAVLGIDGESYLGVVLNTESFANTEYDAYDYNSLCEYENKYYGAKDDGIYELSGDTDDGTYIDAKIITGITDFDTSFMKRVEQAYLGVRNSGNLVLKTIVRKSDGTKAERWYELARQSQSICTQRIKLGKGVRANYWQFEVINQQGCDIELDTLELYPVILSRKV